MFVCVCIWILELGKSIMQAYVMLCIYVCTIYNIRMGIYIYICISKSLNMFAFNCMIMVMWICVIFVYTYMYVPTYVCIVLV